MSVNPEALIDELDQLLERERAALLSGELNRIEQLLEEKEALTLRLENWPVEKPPDLSKIRGKILRNQSLLSSARDGIQAVTARLSELRRVRSALDTYDRDGHRNRIVAHPGSSVEKRA